MSENRTPNREKTIVRTSIVGIAANIFLVIFKAVVGIVSNSIAVILDAVNNLSDALSSVITIIGTKLAGKEPDKKHPLGYGRIEYLTAMVVSGLVLYAGITSLTESVKKIFHPSKPDYGVVSLVIIAAAVAVKLILGAYVKANGKKVNSSSLIASGSDASFDAVLSASVFISALIFILTGVSLEAYVGLVISVIIIKSGIDMMRDTLSDILGKRTDTELARQIKQTVCEDPDVHGAFDLYLYNYGPGKDYGSVHVEVNDTVTAAEIDLIERRIAANVYEKCGIALTAVGIYSRNTSDDEAGRIKKAVIDKAAEYEHILGIHGFYVDIAAKSITFDAVISFDCNRGEVLSSIRSDVCTLYPDYSVTIQPDIDVSE